MGLMKESLDPHLHSHQFLPDENHPHHANQECEKSINNQLMKGRKRGKKLSSSFLPLLFLLVILSSSISSPVSGLSFPSFSFNIFSTNEKESSPVIINPNGVVNPGVINPELVNPGAISHHSIQKRSASRSNSGRNFFGANLQNNRQDLSNAWWRQWWGKFDFFCCYI